ncbi:hypothetical protein M0R88_15215 [Halorussus gelatinilyticus]|uniref:Bacterioopsin transcriptional activator GAF and HTH associated domain-containing protein n=1 Tax=Halorussus gelatinilyticus TaxID=2937524 RepID=A0A8U0IGP2_9EURY|nr:bacterio-opsin activator domain-containing protein [Halorussus gelatinilyticus]UPV99855.1 hypothetical protein M0R88_15215 [Halorussus gelatinilyticus]
MTSIADFTLAADGFPLGKAFEEFPDAVFELDRGVPSDDTVMPYFWVTDASADMTDVRDLLDGLPELRSAVLMEDLGDRGLFRAEWEPEFLGIMTAIAETDVTVISATGSRNGWTFELRGETSDALASRLGISRQAFASRLRRGYRTIVENGLAGEEDGDT